MENWLAEINKINMRLRISIFFSLLLLLGCKHSKKVSGVQFNPKTGYETTWKFFDLKDTVEMKVLAHYKAQVACGNVASASETIGLLKDNKKIRVLEMCNTTKDFPVGTVVNVIPAKNGGFHVMTPTFYKEEPNRQAKIMSNDSTVFKTTFGVIERKVSQDFQSKQDIKNLAAKKLAEKKAVKKEAEEKKEDEKKTVKKETEEKKVKKKKSDKKEEKKSE